MAGSWAVLGHFWAVLGPLGGLLGRLGAVLGASWAVLDGAKARKSYMLKMYVFRKELDGFCLMGHSWGASWSPLGAS